jgi:hypothetical protein
MVGDISSDYYNFLSAQDLRHLFLFKLQLHGVLSNLPSRPNDLHRIILGSRRTVRSVRTRTHPTKLILAANTPRASSPTAWTGIQVDRE